MLNISQNGQKQNKICLSFSLLYSWLKEPSIIIRNNATFSNLLVICLGSKLWANFLRAFLKKKKDPHGYFLSAQYENKLLITWFIIWQFTAASDKSFRFHHCHVQNVPISLAQRNLKYTITVEVQLRCWSIQIFVIN